MSLCVTSLPPDCVKELQRVVARVSDNDLNALLATDPAFKRGGFRAGKPAILRARLEQMVCSGPVISENVRHIIAKRSRACTLTGKLAGGTLLEMRHALAALLGEPVVLVSLLLDARETIRAQAETWLSDDHVFLFLSPNDAVTQLRECFSDLYDLLGKPETEGKSTTCEPRQTLEKWHEQKERYEARVHELQEENRRLHGVDGRLTQAAVKIQKLEGDLCLYKEKAESKESAWKEKKAEAEKYRVELMRELTHREERLNAAVDLRLSSEFFGWLHQAKAVESAAADSAPCENILARAERALKKQAEIDRHSGNRLVLTERLETLRAQKEKVDAALRNAIRLTPELKEAEVALRMEIESVAALLDPEQPASPVEETLLTRIHVASENDLPELRTLPDFIDSLHLLDAGGVRRLREAFQKRLAAVQMAGVPSGETVTPDAPLSLFGRALSGNAPAILLIDGHNVLFGLPSRYNPQRGRAMAESEKRDLLVKDVAGILSPNPAIRAWVVFDGPQRTDHSATQNVRVSYSGGEGEHRADRVLLDNIRFFKTVSAETTVFLVSNDRDLCSEASRLGADTLPVLEFGAFLPCT